MGILSSRGDHPARYIDCKKIFQETSATNYIRSRMLLLLLFLTFSAYWLPTRKTTLQGVQSRSWSAEQGKEERKKVWQRISPPPPCNSFGENKTKIRRRIYMPRRYAGLGSSRVRTRIPSTRRLGQWVSLRKFLRFRVR